MAAAKRISGVPGFHAENWPIRRCFVVSRSSFCGLDSDVIIYDVWDNAREYQIYPQTLENNSETEKR